MAEHSSGESGARGDVIRYANNANITAQVSGERKVIFEGAETSLSASALVLLQREGYNWRTVNGWDYWLFEDETIAERLRIRLEELATAQSGDGPSLWSS